MGGVWGSDATLVPDRQNSQKRRRTVARGRRGGIGFGGTLNDPQINAIGKI